LEFRKFFAELAHVVEQRGCLIVQTGVEQVLCDLFDLLLEFLDFFIFHTYTIPRITENARDFFAISETIFVDAFSNRRLNFYDKDFLPDLARHVRSRLRKSLNIKHLRRAAGRALVSA